MPRLSVVLITRNEAHNIAACLESVAWADEIVVLDSGSSDETVAICRRHGARVEISPDWPGFGPQKNRALDLAGGDWLLSLDADERVTPELRAEIEQVLRAPDAEAYDMPRLSSYLGQPMRHGGWWPDHVTRLFRRGAARFTEARVHEALVVQGRTGRLRNHLVHYSFRTLEQVVAKMDAYSTYAAEGLAQRGRSAGLGSAVLHGLFAFLRTYILRAGFLDGRLGFVLAVSNAEGAYYKYLKLARLSGRLGS
ncbi:MAG TPA: glycosyltransferase family 2 protein [Nevskia sp.]|jgi:glycosyltransferase involved in cell wall biosynthesis|nr:glycosyltransferase family 2 protein [Nevskia sp.]